MTEYTFELPWPPRSLWPNGGHGNRYQVSRDRKSASAYAFGAANASGVSRSAKFVALTFTAHPGGNRPPDDDNVIAAMKKYRDGIAAWLRIDDGEMNGKCAVKFGPKVTGGVIVVTLEVEDA